MKIEGAAAFVTGANRRIGTAKGAKNTSLKLESVEEKSIRVAPPWRAMLHTSNSAPP
jgi:hypothetical protein